MVEVGRAGLVLFSKNPLYGCGLGLLKRALFVGVISGVLGVS